MSNASSAVPVLPLPTENLTVLVEATALCSVYAVIFYIAFLLDCHELDKVRQKHQQ